VVVDGRKAGYSAGMTLRGFAHLFKRLGAVRAMNMDGGGSSTMVVRGRVINRPSDGRERHVSSAVLVLPGPDGGEPRSVGGAATVALPPPRTSQVATRRAWAEAAHDPGSTGGLADALLRGGLVRRSAERVWLERLSRGISGR
jgi:hypothetical protein